MKNLIIGILGGYIISSSDFWIHATNRDRIIIMIVFAVAISTTMCAIDDWLQRKERKSIGNRNV